MRGFSRWARSSATIDEGFGSCFRKVAYSSPELAQEVLDRRQSEAEGMLRYYKCDICAGWHLTKKPLNESDKVVVIDPEEEKRLKDEYYQILWDIRDSIKFESGRKVPELKALKKTKAKEIKEKGYKL